MSVSIGKIRHTTGAIDEPTARSFVPRFLLSRLAEGPITGPERHPVRGALLLSDIEAFTAHVERLVQRGSQGLEEVITDFDRYFSALVKAVHRYHGDILTIAGDSFLCWWPAGADGDVSAATAQAARAALAVHEALAEHASTLPTRIGIAAGEATIGIVGGVGGRWELLPSGPAVADVVACEQSASPGVVLLSAEAGRALGAAASVRPNRDGRAELNSMASAAARLGDAPIAEPLPHAQLERIEGLVPAPVLRWGAADQDWLADFRHVTALMIRLSGPEPVTEEEFEHQHAVVTRFQEIVARFDAAVKVLVDGKGITCSAMFGLPPRAHHDDADRALRAAGEIDELFQEAGFGTGVGVSSGRVCCGVFGIDERREYTLFGDPVNVASRLSSVAAREVLIDEATSEAASLALEVERRPMLALKNRLEPVRVHRLIALRAAPVPKRQVIGRACELAALEGAIERLRDGGTGGAVVIEGEQGIGKSTLAASAAETATKAGLSVFTVMAEPVERGTAYHPWLPLLTSLLSQAEDEDALLAAVGGDPQRRPLLPLLNPFLASPLPETQATAALSGDARADQLGALLSDVIQGQTLQTPGVLLVEDAQWLDSMSWRLLLDVIRRVPRLLTVVTERIAEGLESLTAERVQLRAAPAVQVLTLGQLSSDETATLVRQRLRTTQISPAILSLVLERVSGHPFFCEALLETLIESGAIRVTGQGAQLAEHPELNIPVSIQSALLSRLDRLDATQQLALKAAAVVGRAFTEAEVAAAHPTAQGETVRDPLGVLQDLELLAVEPDQAPATYAFRHRIIQEVAYGLLTGNQRRQMHAALAGWYEAQGPGADGPGPELLGHHWSRAEQPERAARYLEEAGRRALHHGAFKEAVHLLDEAIGATPRVAPERRALQEKALADAHYFLGDMPRSRALLEQALERLGHPIHGGRLELARGLAGGVAAQAAHSLVRRGLRRSSPAERATLLPAVDALRKLVQISYLHGTSTLELSYLIIAGLNLAEQAGPSAELAAALANASGLAGVCGLHRRADVYAHRAAQMAEEQEHSPAAAYVWNVISIMHAGRGLWGTALADNDRALERFGAVGDYNLESELWQTRSALQLCRGALPAAEQAWTHTRELAERTGSPVNLCWSLLDEAQTELARGHIAGGVRALEAAVAIPIVNSDGGTVIERHATTALARLQQGRHAEAVSEADAVIEMLTSRLPTGWVWGEFGVLALEVLLELRSGGIGDVPAAGLDRRIRRGLMAVRRLSLTFAGIRPRVLMLRARTARLAGNWQAAERHLDEAEASSAREDQQFDRARVAIMRAQQCADPARRQALLAAPLRVLQELGQGRELARAEALLR